MSGIKPDLHQTDPLPCGGMIESIRVRLVWISGFKGPWDCRAGRTLHTVRQSHAKTPPTRIHREQPGSRPARAPAPARRLDVLAARLGQAVEPVFREALLLGSAAHRPDPEPPARHPRGGGLLVADRARAVHAPRAGRSRVLH